MFFELFLQQLIWNILLQGFKFNLFTVNFVISCARGLSGLGIAINYNDVVLNSDNDSVLHELSGKIYSNWTNTTGGAWTPSGNDP